LVGEHEGVASYHPNAIGPRQDIERIPGLVDADEGNSRDQLLHDLQSFIVVTDVCVRNEGHTLASVEVINDRLDPFGMPAHAARVEDQALHGIRAYARR
jgi:hypothetical protein